MQNFVYAGSSSRVVFGAGRVAELPQEAQRLRITRPLIITTLQQIRQGEQLCEQLGDLNASLYANATMHTPVEVTERALAALKAHGADGLIAFGGGSTIGLSKALTLRTGLPQIAIPTTYAGSEVTPILGETHQGIKRTQRDIRLLPSTVIYDVELTLSLPVALSASSGLNAIAHAAEALYARDANPITSWMAQEGIGALAKALPVIANHPADVRAREQAQYGAWLCGTCLGTVGMALHHKLCHVLGGSFDLPHAETHALILPYALAYNAEQAPEAMKRIACALGSDQPPWSALRALGRQLNMPQSLQNLAMPESGKAEALELILQDSYWNPRAMEREGLARLLDDAFTGAEPQVR